MLSYHHVEDYLEYLAGYDPGSQAMWITPVRKISLARYDVQIVDSMANNTLFGSALTDRQGELVIKLILKYRRQFTNNGIDITPVENPQFRMPVRKIDRSRSIWIEDDIIKLKFPYNQDYIQQIREFKDSSQGSARWDNDKKLWAVAITEYNVNWLVSWAQSNQFEVSQGLLALMDQILKAEQKPYEIKLVKTADGYTVTNAAKSLLEYIKRYDNDPIKLVDASGVLCYTVDADILEQCSIDYGPALEYIGTRHNVHLSPVTDAGYWDWVLDYAELTQRYPICVYDPGMSTELDLSRFSQDDIVYFDHNGKTKTSNYNPYGVKVVYARRIPKCWDFPVPLLVSTAEMMFGGKRLEWLNKAEKIVYLTNTIINEKN
jgi:hypothetical protein